MTRKNSLSPLGGLKKKEHRDRWVGSHICVCHRLRMESPRALAGSQLSPRLCGGWPGPGTLGGLGRGAVIYRSRQHQVEASQKEEASGPWLSYEIYRKFISCRKFRGGSELNQVSVDISQHSPQENHGKTLFPEAMKIILFYYDTILREDRGVGKNLNNNTEIIHPTGLNFEPASKYENYIFSAHLNVIWVILWPWSVWSL